MSINIIEEHLGYDKKGSKVFLKDLWPSSDEINNLLETVVTRGTFVNQYSGVFNGDENWQSVKSVIGDT